MVTKDVQSLSVSTATQLLLLERMLARMAHYFILLKARVDLCHVVHTRMVMN